MKGLNGLQNALSALKHGSMILVYDGDEREGEADLILFAQNAKPETIETLRRDGGGLICVAVPGSAAERLGLPFYTDLLEHHEGTGPVSQSLPAQLACKKTAYGDKPSFSISINHRNVYTGITDNDRSLTITKFDELIRSNEDQNKTKTQNILTQNFYSPGHVFLLIGRGIENRKGHTELALELARLAGYEGAMVLCEMLGNGRLGMGRALSKKDAQTYAKKNRLVFIEGKEIIQSIL